MLLYIVKCSSQLGNPVENYSGLSELYWGNGIATNVRLGHSNVEISASRTDSIPKNGKCKNDCRKCMLFPKLYVLPLFIVAFPPQKRENRQGRVNVCVLREKQLLTCFL